MEQAVPLHQFQQQLQGASPMVATQHISNVQSQQAAVASGLGGGVFAGPPRPVPTAVPAGHLPGVVAVPVQPAQAAGLAPSLPPSFQMPLTARPPGVSPPPAVAQPPRLAVPAAPAAAAPVPQAGAAGLAAQVPPQIPPAMLPLLGYPLPLLQTMQNVPVEELSKHTGIPLAMLQSQPQMQLAARQIMLQRIMAFQFQAQQQQQQQQRPPMIHTQQAAVLAAAAAQRGVAAAPALKPRAVPKQAKAHGRQPKAAGPRAAPAPASSEGTAGQEAVGGRLIWAKLSSYPWWPAKTLSESDPSYPPDADPPRPTSIPIRFFGTYEFCWIGSKRAIADWDEGYDEHVRGCDQESFRAAVDEVEHYKRTGELPQVFYTRPAPEGRAKARGKRRVRPRSAHPPGAGLVPGSEVDAFGTPLGGAGPGGSARPRPPGKTPQAAVEERAALVRARRKRLKQEMGLAPPDESPYANGRICPNPALLELQQAFDQQWPPASRPPPVTPAPAQPAAPAAADSAVAAQPPATGAAAPAQQLPQPGGIGPAAALAAALAGRPVAQAPPPPGAVPVCQPGSIAVSSQQLHQAAAAPAPPAAAPQAQYAGHPVHQQQQQVYQPQVAPQGLPLGLHNLTPQQQVALMAGLVQQAAAAAAAQQQHYHHQ